MTVEVAAATVIERPIDEVASFAGDPANTPTWCHHVVAADWKTDPPIMLGSQITLRCRVMGRGVVVTFDVVEYSPGSQVELSTTGGPFPVRATSTWRPLSDRATHMVLRASAELDGIRRLAAPFVSFGLRRIVDRDLARLRHLLEHRSPS